MKQIFANLRILRSLWLFKSSKFNEEKFNIIFANSYSGKSTNRHKDDYTIIYFAKIIQALTLQNLNFRENIQIYIYIYIRNLQITCFKMINNLITF